MKGNEREERHNNNCGACRGKSSFSDCFVSTLSSSYTFTALARPKSAI